MDERVAELEAENARLKAQLQELDDDLTDLGETSSARFVAMRAKWYSAADERDQLRAVVVKAALPLEVLIESEQRDGEIGEISPTLRAGIREAVESIRRLFPKEVPT